MVSPELGCSRHFNHFDISLVLRVVLNFWMNPLNAPSVPIKEHSVKVVLACVKCLAKGIRNCHTERVGRFYCEDVFTRFKSKIYALAYIYGSGVNSVDEYVCVDHVSLDSAIPDEDALCCIWVLYNWLIVYSIFWCKLRIIKRHR